MMQNPAMPVYCTWLHRALLPPALHDRFRDLDHFVRDLASSATSRLVIVAPYLSPAGMNGLRDAMVVSAQRGAWIRLITDDLEDPEGWNRRALRTLFEGEGGMIVRKRIRILTKTQALPVLFHAKIVVVDQSRGYLGSANLSLSAMEKNFEVGLALAPNQAEALDGLVSFFESQGLLEDRTALVLPN